MDKFVVDIDKVLDEFEESESNTPPDTNSLIEVRDVIDSPAKKSLEAKSPVFSWNTPPPGGAQQSPVYAPPTPRNGIVVSMQDDQLKVEVSNGHSNTLPPAVKPKTHSGSYTLPSSFKNLKGVPTVSSEKFEEFLRQKSIENAHLLSGQATPVRNVNRQRSVSSPLRKPQGDNESSQETKDEECEGSKRRARSEETHIEQTCEQTLDEVKSTDVAEVVKKEQTSEVEMEPNLSDETTEVLNCDTADLSGIQADNFEHAVEQQQTKVEEISTEDVVEDIGCEVVKCTADNNCEMGLVEVVPSQFQSNQDVAEVKDVVTSSVQECPIPVVEEVPYEESEMVEVEAMEEEVDDEEVEIEKKLSSAIEELMMMEEVLRRQQEGESGEDCLDSDSLIRIGEDCMDGDVTRTAEAPGPSRQQELPQAAILVNASTVDNTYRHSKSHLKVIVEEEKITLQSESESIGYHRTISFDPSQCEVTEEDLTMLEQELKAVESEVQEELKAQKSIESKASIEPVSRSQVLESEAAENVVNNNNSVESNGPPSLDNPFIVKAAPLEQRSAVAADEHLSEAPATEEEGSCREERGFSEDDELPDDEGRLPRLDDEAEVQEDDNAHGAVGGSAIGRPITHDDRQLGRVKPMWIQDEDAPICMNCGHDFTIFRRRHHCRACGKVLCGACCKDRAKLEFMEGEIARVCGFCIEVLVQVERLSDSRSPNPNNPYEYCSILPPLAQLSSTSSNAPTVMVPVGVLKKSGGEKSSGGCSVGGGTGPSKSVMFSDGIRPGGDLTDLDIPSPPPSARTPTRVLKQITTGSVARKYRKYTSMSDSAGALPVVLLAKDFPPYEQPMPTETLFNILQDSSLPAVSFALTRHNLHVQAKIVQMDCCLNTKVWSFCSQGLAAFGQEEVMFVLEFLPDDKEAIPRDVFRLYKILYENACRGSPVSNMDHLLFPGGLFGSNQHTGFIFIRNTLQCVVKLVKPRIENNYLVAMLIQKSEVPWARLFPLRLILRLGAEYRYYPCPLMSVRFRKPVYFDGSKHTIMTILADFRNYQYTVQNIPGLVIHMLGKKTTIKAPRNRYELMMKASTTNENILAVGANFSKSADSHLVCVQGDDGTFQSQAINIANSTIKVTGASFLVFSGALKSNCGYTAKSSIVEDGLLVQITPSTMQQLKQAIHDMTDYRIVCKETKPNSSQATGDPPATPGEEEEFVELVWVDNERTQNEGVLSAVDGTDLAGVPSCKIYSGTDYSTEKFMIRWTEVFFLASKDTELDLPEPHRLIEATARSMCMAMLAHASKLYERDLTKMALRISLDPEQFGYEVGAMGKPLASEYLTELDNALVPIITNLDGSHQPMTIELVFYVLVK